MPAHPHVPRRRPTAVRPMFLEGFDGSWVDLAPTIYGRRTGLDGAGAASRARPTHGTSSVPSSPERCHATGRSTCCSFAPTLRGHRAVAGAFSDDTPDLRGRGIANANRGRVRFHLAQDHLLGRSEKPCTIGMSILRRKPAGAGFPFGGLRDRPALRVRGRERRDSFSATNRCRPGATGASLRYPSGTHAARGRERSASGRAPGWRNMLVKPWALHAATRIS